MLPPLVSVAALPKLRSGAAKPARAEKAPGIERRLQQARRARRRQQNGSPQNDGDTASAHAAPHRRQRRPRDDVDKVRAEMTVAVPRHRRLEALGTALGQLHDTTQTMLDEITALQRELSVVNADESLFASRPRQQSMSPEEVTTAQHARIDGRASLPPSFRTGPTMSSVSLGVTAQLSKEWFRAEAGRFGPTTHRDDAADLPAD